MYRLHSLPTQTRRTYISLDTRTTHLVVRHRITLTSLILLALIGPQAKAQTLSKEYVRLGAQVVAIENGSAPAVTLSASALSYAPQTLDTPSTGQTIILTNAGNGLLSFNAYPTLTGANAADFVIAGTNCDPNFTVAAGSTCGLTANFTPQGFGLRTASLIITDNAGNSPGTTQTIALSGTGSGTPPSGFIGYLAPFGATQSPFTGPDVVLPLRVYYSSGAANINIVQIYLSSSSGAEYTIDVNNNGSGAFALRLVSPANAVGVPNPNLALSPTGNTVTLPAPITLSTIAITAYRFALAGNELQLDLSLTRAGTFSDQISIDAASTSNALSTNAGASLAPWTSSPSSGSTCNGASIATSIVLGDGSWQCWAASSLTTSSYGNPYWNGESGDGPSANIGWLLLGTGNYGVTQLGAAPGPLGYFGLPGGEESANTYFANAGTPVAVNLVAALTFFHYFDTLGWYPVNPAAPNTPPTAANMHLLVGPFTGTAPGPLTATFQPTSYYGLYIVGPTGTYFSQAQLNSDSLQHFAIFQQSATFYYIGVEDTDRTESDLDYNDMVVTLSGVTSAATYSGPDTTTQGTWTGKYGSKGELIANDANSPPSFATVSIQSDSLYTWAASTTDTRALQTASGATTRIASAYYSSTGFTINFNLTDGNTHQISLYLLDWDTTARVETISILDALTKTVLDTRTFSSFHNGEYAVWKVKGNVVIQVTQTSGANAAVSGIFFD